MTALPDRPTFCLFAYPWDIADGDPRERLGEIAALGVDTASVALAYHAGKFIRPAGRAGKVIFPEDGTVSFAPDPGRYGRIEPKVSSLAGRCDLVAEWSALAGALRLEAWAVLLHNTAIGMAHPDCVAVNAYGDPYWYSLEPSHPDVAEYAVALALDLAARPSVASLAIETPGYLPYVHGYHHEFQQVPLDPYVEALLGLSFHETVMKAARQAGVAADLVREGVRRRLDRWFDEAPAIPADMVTQRLLAEIVADADLHAFLRWRAEPVTAILKRIRAGLPTGKRMRLIPSVQRPSALAWLEGTDYAAQAPIVDAVACCFYEPIAARVAADLHDMLGRVPAARLAGILRPGHPDLSAGAEIGAAVGMLRAAGVEEIGFYNHGLLRRSDLERIAGVIAEHRR